MRPEEIIIAFDECREYFFGCALGRDNPQKSDLETAQAWIDEGVTLATATIVFTEQMAWMHEKFLKHGGGKDRSYLPASLKVFDENIEVAIRKVKNGGHFDIWESEILRWRCRCRAWSKDPSSWKVGHWGPAPFEKGCRVPKEVLANLNAVQYA